MATDRAILSFGRGVDRATGVVSADPASPRDLTNLYAREQTWALRPGLSGTGFEALPWGTDILCIAPLRATKDILFVLMDRATREVRIYRLNPIAGEVLLTEDSLPILTEDDLPLYTVSYPPQLAGTWGTLNADADFPVITYAESDGKLFFAHEEELLTYRLPTVYYTPDNVDTVVGTLTTLQADLNGDGTPADVYFRGVAPFYSMLVGWGYGSEDPGDSQRVEIVRLSVPGKPTEWRPESYFIAGARRDPVVACVLSEGNLAVLKQTEVYTIFGDSPANFTIQLTDADYGCLATRAVVTAGREVLIWSATGPRALSNGRTVNVGLPLELDGPRPAGRVADGESRLCFAVFDAERVTVEFLFPRVTWTAASVPTPGYIASLRDPTHARWGYTERQRCVLCAARVRDDKGEPPQVVGFVSGVTAADDGLDTDERYRRVELSWTNVAANGDETVQVFGKPDGGGWSLVGAFAVSGLTQAAVVTGLQTLTAYEFALRYERGGDVAAGYEGNDPDAWTATTAPGARASATTSCETPTGLTGVWSRVNPTQMRVALSWANLQTFVPQRTEISSDNVNWTPLTSFPGTSDVTTNDELFDNSFIEATRYFRVRPVRGTVLGTPSASVMVAFGNGLVPAFVGSVTASEAVPISCGIPWELDVNYATLPTNNLEYRVQIDRIESGSPVLLDADAGPNGPYRDNTSETGDPFFTGFWHARQYRVSIIRRADDALVALRDTALLGVDTGPAC